MNLFVFKEMFKRWLQKNFKSDIIGETLALQATSPRGPNTCIKPTNICIEVCWADIYFHWLFARHKQTALTSDLILRQTKLINCCVGCLHR